MAIDMLKKLTRVKRIFDKKEVTASNRWKKSMTFERRLHERSLTPDMESKE